MADADPIERLLPASLRAVLARRELIVRRPVAGARHGVHRSLRPGLGRDFRDYRPYVPGDDPRQLDWRAAARSQRLVVRQTESEEELELALVVDGSGGMAYGEGHEQKWQRAGMIAAALASLALRQGDRVGVALGRDGELELAAARPVARRDRQRALAQLWSTPPAGRCDWPGLLAAIEPQLRRRALIVVISDFLDPGAGAGQANAAGTDEGEGPSAADEALVRDLASLRSAGHDLLVVQLVHRDELEFPWHEPRVLEFEDLRGQRPRVEGAGQRLREAYLRRVGAHLAWLEAGCEQYGLMLARLTSDDDPVAQLLELLARLAGLPAQELVEAHEHEHRDRRGPGGGRR